MQKPPFEPGRFDAYIFEVRRDFTDRFEVAVPYSEKVYGINTGDRIIDDEKTYFTSGGGFQNYRELGLRFEVRFLIPQWWHEDNLRANRDYVGRKNFGRVLRREFGLEHKPIMEIKPDIGRLYNIEDFF